MLYTFGHSTLPWPEFLQLTARLDVLIDVRSHPGSRWPQFQQEFMRDQLKDRYQWWLGLGGWTDKHLDLQEQFPMVDLTAYAQRKFPKQRIAKKVAEGDGPTWTNVGLMDYSYFMMTPEFIRTANQLFEVAQVSNVGIFCCEALYYKCHRSMIADYAVYCGCDAIHLSGNQTKTLGYRVYEKLHSDVLGDRLERYPRVVHAAWGPV